MKKKNPYECCRDFFENRKPLLFLLSTKTFKLHTQTKEGVNVMSRKVYTTYWESRLGNIRKEHGTYESEEKAMEGINAWWELHGEEYPEAEFKRTNSGALEIVYDNDDFAYRIEERTIEGSLPKLNYKLKSRGETDALRKMYDLHEELCVFDELAEPFRDRLILAMADIAKARNYIYDRKGRPVRKIKETLKK